MLIFDPATGTCIKEIFGDAVVDEGVGYPRPPDLASAPIRFLILVDGVVQQRAETPEELATREKWTIREALVRALIEDRFRLENRIRALEGKPTVTIDQFKAELKTTLGI